MKAVIVSAAVCVSSLVALGNAVAAPSANNHQLDVTFAQADKNKDGFLDAGDLAKAFRGANAKVIDDSINAKETHADHAFLALWDADRDGRISRAEFEKYEARAFAEARTVANKNRVYTRTSRSHYRAPQRHRGYSARGYGTNPYTTVLRAQQRAYQQQRAAFNNRLRYGVYSPVVRGGYRGVQRHHHGRR